MIFENNFWKISGTHDGYSIKFGTIYEREIEFYPEQMKFIGYDKLFRKNPNKEIKFDIRFHLDPNSKVMKTQDNKSILVELDEEGWKFSCDNFDINIDNGLYFGNKNSYKENQNIRILGVNMDSNIDDAKSFVNQFNISFTSVIDKEFITISYGVSKIPETFLIDKDGKIKNRISGKLTSEKLNISENNNVSLEELQEQEKKEEDSNEITNS